jgi:hypothetical protein
MQTHTHIHTHIYIYIHIYLLSHLAEFFLEWKPFQTNVEEDIKTHILCSLTSFQTPCRLQDNVENYSRARKATDDKTAHALCILQTKVYKHTLRIG